jgi:hypothetical protein
MRGILTCNDGVLFIALGYSIVVLVLKWEQYQTCKYPLQLFLLVNYSTILLFRLLGIAQAITSQHNIRTLLAIAVIRVVALFGFFIAWTVTGTVWFALDHSCLPEDNQFAIFIIWFVLCYLGILGYSTFLYLVFKLDLARQVFLNPRGILPGPDNPILAAALGARGQGYEEVPQGLGEQDIDRLPIYIVSAEEALEQNSCAICLELLEEDQAVRVLLPCEHRFHCVHIEEWLLLKSTCPVCRRQVEIPAAEAAGHV